MRNPNLADDGPVFRRPQSAARAKTSGGWTALRRIAAVSLVCLAAAACAPKTPEPKGAPMQSGAAGRQGAPTIVGGTSTGDPLQQRSLTPGFAVPVDPGAPAVVALLAPVSAEDPGVRAAADALVAAARLASADLGDPLLQLKIYDTKADPAIAAAAATAAAEAGAAIILGPLFSQSTAAVAPIARQRGLATISFSSDPAVASDAVFLLSFLADQEVERVVGYAASRGVLEIATMAPSDKSGQLAFAAARRAAASAGGVVVDQQAYQRTFEGIEAAVTEYAERILGSDEDAQPSAAASAAAIPATPAEAGPQGPPQGIVLADDGQALQTLAAYLAFFDISPRETKFLGISSWNQPATLRETALRGGWFAAPDPSLRAQFDARFQAALGAAPHPLAPLAYDAVAAAGALLSDARNAGVRYPFSPQTIAAPAGFIGVNGLYRFLPNGLNQRGLAVMEVRNGAAVMIDPAPTSFGGL